MANSHGEGRWEDLREEEFEELRRELKEREVVAAAEVFATMADPTRLAVLFLLSRRNLCAHDLGRLVDRAPSTITHHLNLLREAKLVVSEKRGKHVVSRLADEHVRAMLDVVRRHLADDQTEAGARGGEDG